MPSGFSVTPLREIPLVPKDEEGEPDWHAVQYYLSLSAYGVNVYVAPQAGTELIREHDELKSGQEELYFVLGGRARFTLDGEEFETPAGTFVAVRKPGVRRGAVAEKAGTTVLAIGARPTGRFISSWEQRHFEGVPRESP